MLDFELPTRVTLFPYTTLFRSVPLAAVAEALRLLAERNRVIAEGAGATPVAVALAGLPEITEGKKIVCRSEEHTSELQSPDHILCRHLLEKTNIVADEGY